MRDKIISQLDQMLNESDVTTSEVGEQRERNHRYYTMEPLGNERKGRSHYIDPTVLSAVEGKKALFSETFLSTRDVVRFSGDFGEAKTAYVKGQMQKNQYERLFRDCWHDAFVAKRCTVWASWEQDTKDVELQFNGALNQQVNQQIAQLGDVVSVDTSQLQGVAIPSIGQPVFQLTGPVTVTLDDSCVRLELHKPEKVYRDPNASYTDVASWNAIELERSRGQLLEAGYDPEQVAKLTMDYTYSSKEEDYARKQHDQSHANDYRHGAIKEHEIVTTYKVRGWFKLEEDSIEDYVPETTDLALYEICWGKNQILRYADGTPHVTRIDEMGVFEWSEMKISHAESGMCTADVEAHRQKTLSALKRGILDNLNITNNPRYEAVQDRLINPRDLLDNIIGGVSWSEQIGSIAALPQPQLSPQTLPAIQLVKQDSEESSGLSSLAKGMNSDAVKYQNADSMIERLTNAGTRRVTMQARDFAYTFLVPLMKHIATLGSQNDRSQDVMEMGGRQVPIVPAQWRDGDNDVEVTVALTPDEAEDMARRMILVHNLKSQDPQIGPMYGAQQRHAFYDQLYELLGVKDASPYLLPPESHEYQQAMQMQQQQAMQAQQKQDQLAQFQMFMLNDDRQRQWAELNNKIMDTIHDNDLDADKFEHEVFKDNEELRLEEQQQRGVNVG